MFSDMSANEGGQPTDKVPYSIQELQKRYTERHKRRQEEKTLLKLIGDVKAQITQVKTIENILFFVKQKQALGSRLKHSFCGGIF